ncbi:neurogenic protein mastermind isoform X5 [Nasonia vitripennis]|uniref:C3H1-type domain-containing protein n=1 Tax=Nasonia vitripennis TaxID=7425 RepID=A0A7M7QQ36_NASVI|nr:neurogenic protein mastermind isoform X5 [Nasonia vitripennis]XP_032452838.1 neurogenic protein mastermind isoform X5 [Nasonia vitripennis]
MAMVNMNNLLNGKDSRWLQLEVCREFQRQKCTRPDTECKFAHPPANVEVQNGRVTACYDSIKGRCNREKPPCKYFHPPQHLKDQLLINGRNHLALKNALMQQMGLSPGQPLVPGQVPTVESQPPAPSHQHLQQQIQQQLLATHALMATNPYLPGMPQVGNTYSPYFAPSPIMPTIMGPDPTGVGSPLGVVQQTVAMPQKMPRTDRLETAQMPIAGAVSANAVPGGLQNANMASIELGKKRMRDSNDDLLMMDMKSVGSLYYENFAFPGMVPYKRPAGDKSGVPVYQPTGATTYQQLMQLQQPFVPVSCEYTGTPPLPGSQNSSQSVVGAVQNSIQSQASNAANAEAAANGILVDPNNPPPPPPSSATNDKQSANANHESESSSAVGQNSHELNHSGSSSQQQQQQQAQQQQQQQQQINQQIHHALSAAAAHNASMNAITSMAGLSSVPNLVSANSMASSIANLNSINNMNYTMANMTNINALNSLGMPSNLSFNPAALAKEVAQKNYAKAIKLSQQAAANQQAAAASYGINPLNPLNYTGVALNKQTLASLGQQPGAGVPGAPAPRAMIPGLAGLHAGTAGLSSPLPAGLLAYRPPPSATPINPYSFMRQQALPGNPYAVQASIPGASVQASPYVQNPYAMLPGMPGVAGAMQQIPATGPATIAAQPQVAIPAASTGVIMQPYKKMKTT